MRKVERQFWKPSVTSQFRICPVPFHFDTYRGCTYGCIFCFARDITEFSRRNKKNPKERRQSYLIGNVPKSLANWCESVSKKEYNFLDAPGVAFKERIPVKIGATADPFPLCELDERITYDCLKVFAEYDYPVQISTKNPEIFLQYAKEFVDSNIALNVSTSFHDDAISQKIEVGAISPSRRFEAVRKLSEMGFKVTMRLQPFILPYSLEVADEFVAKLASIGAYAFQTEGLKIRAASSQKEKAAYAKIGKVFGFDILQDFAKRGEIEGGDRVYHEVRKREMLARYDELSHKYGIKFFNADNLVDKNYGCGCECCGTDFLRNHKIWGGNIRTAIMGDNGVPTSTAFGECIINFGRSTKNVGHTIKQVCNEYILEYKRAEYKKRAQLSLF